MGGNADAHRFAVIELPLNLYEHRPATAALGKEGTLLAQAEKAGLAVLTNRPLNVILGYAEMALDRAVDSPQRDDCVRGIAASGRDLLAGC